MKAFLLFSSLSMFAAGVPGPWLRHPGLPQRVVGKLLEWSVEAGMTQEQVVAVFGEPDTSGSYIHGPIGHGYTIYSYFKYDATVTFVYKPCRHTKGRPPTTRR